MYSGFPTKSRLQITWILINSELNKILKESMFYNFFINFMSLVHTKFNIILLFEEYGRGLNKLKIIFPIGMSYI